MPYPVHLNKRRRDRGTCGEYLIDGCGEFVSPARLKRQGPNLQRTVDRKCDELPDPKELDVVGGRRPFVLGQQKHEACIGDDSKYDAKYSRTKNAVLCVQPPGNLLFEGAHGHSKLLNRRELSSPGNLMPMVMPVRELSSRLLRRSRPEHDRLTLSRDLGGDLQPSREFVNGPWFRTFGLPMERIC